MAELALRSAAGRIADGKEFRRVTVEVDGRREGPTGNLFLALEHVESGRVWRRLRWSAARGGYVFDHLPAGRYRLRAWTSRRCRSECDFVFDAPELRVAIRLPDPTVSADQLLEIDATEELDRWRTRLRAVDGTDVHARIAGELPDGSSAYLLAAMLGDVRVVLSATRSARDLRLADDLWSFVNGENGSGALPAELLHMRIRFTALTFAILTNPMVRQRLSPTADDAELWSTVLLVVDGIDTPELDDLMLWMGRIHRPATAGAEVFARAWLERYDGLYNLRTHETLQRRHRRGNRARPAVAALPGAPGEQAFPAAAAAVLADAARVLHSCLPRSA